MNNYITKTVGKTEKNTFNFLSNITNGFCPCEKQNVTLKKKIFSGGYDLRMDAT